MHANILIFLVFGVAAVAFVAPFFFGKRKAQEEIGLTPLYEDRYCRILSGFGGAGSYGGYGRVTFYENFLVASLFSPKVVPYHEIKLASIVKIRWYPFISLTFDRELLGFSKTLQFSSAEPERILAIVRHKCPGATLVSRA